MEIEKLEEIMKFEKTELDINMMSPLIWAYIGDAVYELYVRTYLINTTNYKPHKLHVEAIKYVKAEAQAKYLEKIQDILTDEEQDVVRRARNTQNHHVPKNADITDYMYATAFEGLIGYLYLHGRHNRISEILHHIYRFS